MNGWHLGQWISGKLEGRTKSKREEKPEETAARKIGPQYQSRRGGTNDTFGKPVELTRTGSLSASNKNFQ